MLSLGRRWLAKATTADLVAAFEVMGLTYRPNASSSARPSMEQVRRQYRELARLHHPDLSSGDDQRMTVINTAYELIQGSGILQAPPTQAADSSSTHTADPSQSVRSTFTKKAGLRRRRRLPDDFASGDDQSSWTLKGGSLEWQHFMNATDGISAEQLRNPAHHPFSHSKFFSFEDDLTIYKMIRGGATVAQVGRTLGKPNTFIEKRLHNPQFKLRVQYVLRSEKRQTTATASSSSCAGSGSGSAAASSSSSSVSMHERVLRRSPYDSVSSPSISSEASSSNSSARRKFRDRPTSHRRGEDRRKTEWEATMPRFEQPRYVANMTLEEKGEYYNLIKQEQKPQSSTPAKPTRGAGKIGRSYTNFSRIYGGGAGGSSSH